MPEPKLPAEESILVSPARCDEHPETPAPGCVVCHQRLLARITELEHDAMTGLLRREVGIARAIRLARRRLCVVVFVDVDGLKPLNTVARSRGDWALQLVADAVNNSCRAGDFGFRHGGDEFVFVGPVMPSTALIKRRQAKTLQIAERIAERIEQAVLQASGGEVSVTTGAACFQGSEADLLRLIDEMSATAEQRKGRKRQDGVGKPRLAIQAAGDASRALAGTATESDERKLLARSSSMLEGARRILAGDPEAQATAAALAIELAGLLCVRARQGSAL